MAVVVVVMMLLIVAITCHNHDLVDSGGADGSVNDDWAILGPSLADGSC